MPVNRCVACVLATTTGRVLVQWELDATLPFHYPQLALLVASLVQFSKAQEFAQLELANGYTLIVRSDAVSQLSCVVVCRTPLGDDSRVFRKSLDMAHLKSLVILHEFLRCFRSHVDELVVESKASVASMADKYTLSSALGGGDDGGADADDGTMDAFVAFQNEFIAPMVEDNSAENIRAGISDSVVKASAAPVEITRQFLMNADTGSPMYSLMGVPKLHLRHWFLEESLPTQKLLARVARALSACFPILQRTALFQRSARDSCVGFANAGSASPTTVVLRVGGGEPPKDAAASGWLYIAVQMIGVGTFASVVFFNGPNDRFLGHASEIVRSGDLQRVLISDPRGGHLLALVHEGAVGSQFQIHVGSDGAPEVVLQALESVVAPWTKFFEAAAE